MALKLGFYKSIGSLALTQKPTFNPLPAHVKWTHKKKLVISCKSRIDLPKIRAKDFPAWVTYEPKALKVAAILVELYQPIIRIHLIAGAIYVLVMFITDQYKSFKEATAAPSAAPKRIRSPAAKTTLSAVAQYKYRAQLNSDMMALMDVIPFFPTNKSSVLQLAIAHIKALEKKVAMLEKENKQLKAKINKIAKI